MCADTLEIRRSVELLTPFGACSTGKGLHAAAGKTIPRLATLLDQSLAFMLIFSFLSLVIVLH